MAVVTTGLLVRSGLRSGRVAPHRAFSSSRGIRRSSGTCSTHGLHVGAEALATAFEVAVREQLEHRPIAVHTRKEPQIHIGPARSGHGISDRRFVQYSTATTPTIGLSGVVAIQCHRDHQGRAEEGVPKRRGGPRPRRGTIRAAIVYLLLAPDEATTTCQLAPDANIAVSDIVSKALTVHVESNIY